MEGMKAEETRRAHSPAPEDRRRRKALRTREALARAAMELVLEEGLDSVTVEAIAERADVTRRTFSRYFSGKEEAALDFARADTERINAALRARPDHEPPLSAYRAAVADWLADPAHAWQDSPGYAGIFALVDSEPTMFAAFERVRVEAQAESVRILATRLGVDPERDPRPAAVVGAAAGVLLAALRLWVRGGHASGEDLPALVDRVYATLVTEAGRVPVPPQHSTESDIP
ncbi:transcriptional regulator, TetR family [Streptomyces sp. LcepLS]|nr:putative TetR family transcriptional regulator [Streptomyces sp. Tu6071]SCD50014.1 transcriptional regulator, TetR family [Streptomyces sp. TverLS-915]SCE26499.1 transcriptional regulator, TetR family [Streptomyces sp. SolWspMP-sol7th]SCE59190.1 transcriptional regulator, TetR family [Streptomyces sp. DfronAA-171]SCE82203.1 transcriptional regulator, TetR family [Streptomyces sp. LcepLS]